MGGSGSSLFPFEVSSQTLWPKPAFTASLRCPSPSARRSTHRPYWASGLWFSQYPNYLCLAESTPLQFCFSYVNAQISPWLWGSPCAGRKASLASVHIYSANCALAQPISQPRTTEGVASVDPLSTTSISNSPAGKSTFESEAVVRCSAARD